MVTLIQTCSSGVVVNFCFQSKFAVILSHIHRKCTPVTMKDKSASLRGTTDKGMARKNSIHWFRKGLRLHDNPALLEAIRDSASYRCVYILDPWFAGSSQVGINKWRWVSFIFCVWLSSVTVGNYSLVFSPNLCRFALSYLNDVGLRNCARTEADDHCRLRDPNLQRDLLIRLFAVRVGVGGFSSDWYNDCAVCFF